MTVNDVHRIVRISRNVTDLLRSVNFYQDRLGFTQDGPTFRMQDALVDLLGFRRRTIKIQRMRLGGQQLELLEVGAEGRSYPQRSTSADLWFQHIAIRCDDIGSAFRQLYRNDSSATYPSPLTSPLGRTLSPIQLPASSGGAIAFKFRDPDGHPVELLQLPGGSRNRPPFHRALDHTAVSVSNVEASIKFYTRNLSMTTGTRQINSGPAQGALDHLHDAVVDVVALQTLSQTSPHLELLGYRNPVGTALLHAAKPNDVGSDRIVLAVRDLRALMATLDATVRLVELDSHVSAGLISDPDGHLILLVG